MKKLDIYHFLILFGTPLATAFLDYEVNSASPFSKQTLSHAALATALVGVALVKQWAQAQVTPTAPPTLHCLFMPLLCLVLGCSGSTPKPAGNAQAAQQAVSTAADAWTLAANACLAAAGANPEGGAANPALAHECRVLLQPVHDAIVEAQVAASVWDDAAQAHFPCVMADVARGLTLAVTTMAMPTPVADAAIVAGQFGSVCHDAG